MSGVAVTIISEDNIQINLLPAPDIQVEVVPIHDVAVTIISEDNIHIDLLPTPDIQVEVVPIHDVAITVAEVSVGLKGDKGEPGSGNRQSITAGEDLGGHRVVTTDSLGNAIYASRDNVAHAGHIVGITTGAIVHDASGDVQFFGVMEEPSWSWVVNGQIFLGINGLLTQIVPSSGFIQIVGYSITETSMFVNVEAPILL